MDHKSYVSYVFFGSVVNNDIVEFQVITPLGPRYKRGRSFFIFKPQFERENITNNANPFLYCAEICPSLYVQSI